MASHASGAANSRVLSIRLTKANPATNPNRRRLLSDTGSPVKAQKRTKNSASSRIDERFRAEQPEKPNRSAPEMPGASDDGQDGRQRESVRDRQRGEKELARDRVGRNHDQEPERMREGLHSLARVEHRAVAVQHIPDRTKRNVRVVAEPGVRQEHVGECGRQARDDDAGVSMQGRRRAAGQWYGVKGGNHGKTMEY